MKIMLGADPEVFLHNLQHELRSSIGKIGGSKLHPMPLPLGDGYCVQEDNVAVEFNIPPAASMQEFVESIRKTLSFLNDGIKSELGLEFSNLSAAYFPKEELKDPAALEFGCDPDYNAWTGKRNPRPKATDDTLRSCGGHVHIGLSDSVDKQSVIRFMDLHLGVPSVLMDNGELRKQLYGKAGAYRDKVYGVEYRTLSNFWIFQDKTIEWVWKATERAVAAAESRHVLDDAMATNIQEAINNNNKKLAESLVNHYQLEMV